ncbi:MAG: nitrous oxide reductase accessory protein NosL [Kiritimatiellaeota bacterium]|nr:nitrous oxide reductase accessory protein NosL [Kiritimatiellota bacterium]
MAFWRHGMGSIVSGLLSAWLLLPMAAGAPAMPATRCQACGMDAAKSETEYILSHKLGAELHACSVACARKLMNAEITALATKDRVEHKLIAAATAIYVRDSRKMPKGSMPPFVFAFASRQAAEAFHRREGGTIRTFEELIKELTAADQREAAAESEAVRAPATVTRVAPAAGPEVYPTLAKPGAKIELADGRTFTYGFEKAPKLTTCIMRVQISDSEGRPDTSYIVQGDADMPSMRGAHSTGLRDFSLSEKGLYLLPVRLVMPGDWEVRFTFIRDQKVVFRGAYLFDL